MIKRTKNKFAILWSDPHMREVARGTLLAFMLKVIGSALAFAFNVVVARLLGAEGAGIYFLALAITTIGSVIGRIGLDTVLLRHIATTATHKDWPGVRGVYAQSMRMAFVASIAVLTIAFLIAPWMANIVFNKPELLEPLRWMVLSILPLSILALQSESLKGLMRIRDALLAQSVGIPLISLILVVPFAQKYGVSGVSFVYFVSAILTATLGVWVWHRRTIVFGSEVVMPPIEKLWKSCKPMFVVALMKQAILPFAPILLLGLWASNEEVGIFGAASRVAMLVSFILITVNSVVAPKFAELYAKKEIEKLGQVARRSAMMTTLIVLPLFVLLIAGGHHVMAMFGPQFTVGSTVLAILLIGQFINVASGSVGYLLTMTGHEKTNARLTVLSGAVLVLASIILIPSLGAIGAAIASSASLVVFNLAAFVMAGRLLNIKMVWFNIGK